KTSLGEELDPAVETFDVEAYAQRLARPGNIVPRGYLAVFRQAEQLLEEDNERSLRTGLAFMMKALDLLGIMSEHMHRFFFMLAYLAARPDKLGIGERILGAIYYRINRLIFSLYDRNAPNYRSHVALVTAEEHRRAGRTL